MSRSETLVPLLFLTIFPARRSIGPTLLAPRNFRDATQYLWNLPPSQALVSGPYVCRSDI